MKNRLQIFFAIFTLLLIVGCDGSGGSTTSQEDDFIVFNDMNLTEQLVYLEQMGFSRSVLSEASEEDLDLCNNLELADENATLWCESNSSDLNANYQLLAWMSYLPDTTKLNEIIMPGSHDAGIYQCEYISSGYSRLMQENLTKTQNLDMYYQLIAGARYFDIRLEYRDNKLRTYHRSWVGAHDVGCTGDTLHQILVDANQFLNLYNKETIIIKLSHFRSAEAYNKTINYLNELFPAFKHRLYITNNASKNLSELELGDATKEDKTLRGKIILVFEPDIAWLSDVMKVQSILGRHYYKSADVSVNKVTYNAKYFPFHTSATLGVYDEYSDSDNLLVMEADQNCKRIKTAGLGQPYLSLLSWTLTQPSGIAGLTAAQLANMNLWSIRSLAASANARIPNYLHTLWEESQNLPNIVFYDYVSPEVNLHIVQYNFFKQSMKPISDRYYTPDGNYIYPVSQKQLFLLGANPNISFFGDLEYLEYLEYFTDETSYNQHVFRFNKMNWYTLICNSFGECIKNYGYPYVASTKENGGYPYFDISKKYQLNDFKFNENRYWMVNDNPNIGYIFVKSLKQ